MIYNEEKRDLFSVSDDYYLTHCISADFEMGKGIVVEFNKRFNMKNILQCNMPDYLDYFQRARLGGDCIIEGKVFNLITKERYYHKPTIITMKIALQRMKEICMEHNVNKVAMPLIGCGLDRLRWNKVRDLINNTFKEMDIEILVCIQ